MYLKKKADQLESYRAKGVQVVGVANELTDRKFEQYVNKKLEWDFPNALDTANLTRKLYGVPLNRQTFFVVVDHEGKVMSERSGLALDRTLDKALAAARNEDTVAPRTSGTPDSEAMQEVKKLIRRKQYARALRQARRLPRSTPAAAAARRQFLDDIEAIRIKSFEDIQRLEKSGRSLEAYFAAARFVKEFRSAKEAYKVSAIHRKLARVEEVKRHLTARKLFLQASKLLAHKHKQRREQGSRLLAQVAKDFANTVYGRYAARLAGN